MNRALMVGVVVAAVVAVAGLTHVILFPDEGRPDLKVEDTEKSTETASERIATRLRHPKTRPRKRTRRPRQSEETDASSEELPPTAESCGAGGPQRAVPDEDIRAKRRQPRPNLRRKRRQTQEAAAPSEQKAQMAETGDGREAEQDADSEAATDEPAVADPPEFDIVRVGEDGITVVAGRAQPGATVSVFDGDKRCLAPRWPTAAANGLLCRRKP